MSNPIKDAVEILRNIKGTPAEIGRAWIVADELEALANQDPAAYLHRLEKITELSFFDESANCTGRKDYIGTIPLYAAPVCDLKALAEDVLWAGKEWGHELERTKLSQTAMIETPDIGAIISKHTKVGA